MNQGTLVSLEGGTCVIQGKRREVILKCKLKAKDNDKDLSKKELRFESELVEEGTASKLDELVIMDSIAYAFMKNREFVFKKGSVFAEPSQNKEYDYAYSLVSPVSQAPMVLLLS
jgi:hypothetical protein